MAYRRRTTRFNGNAQSIHRPSQRGAPVSIVGHVVATDATHTKITLTTGRPVSVDTSKPPDIRLRWLDGFNVPQVSAAEAWGNITPIVGGTEIEILFPLSFRAGPFHLNWPQSSIFWGGIRGEAVGVKVFADWGGFGIPELVSEYSGDAAPIQKANILGTTYVGSGNSSFNINFSPIMNTSLVPNGTDFMIWGPDGAGNFASNTGDLAAWIDPLTLELSFAAPTTVTTLEFITWGGNAAEILSSDGAALTRTLRGTIW